MSNTDSGDDAHTSSDEDCKMEKPKKKNVVLRKSVRLIKKPKTYTSSEDDASQVVDKTKRNGLRKRKPYTTKHLQFVRLPHQAPVTFTNGAFVVAKNDVQCYDSGTPPHIWRIDGKALLQKFEPVTEGTDLKYRNTSIVSKLGKRKKRKKSTWLQYTGWSEIEIDNYSIIQNINFIYNTPQRCEITFPLKEFKKILMDSE